MSFNEDVEDFKEEITMAVAAGVLYEVKGDAARQMIQELCRPTEEQIDKRRETTKMIKEYANILRLKVKK